MSSKEIANMLIDCFKRGNKVLICGNGGSASMAQHMAAELVCKFEHDRLPLPAIALTTDTSVLTAWSNDVEFDGIFSRQVQALGQAGDVLVVLSTSGKSANCNYGASTARAKGLTVIDFPRKGATTAKIQEYQLKLMHSVVGQVEKAFI